MAIDTIGVVGAGTMGNGLRDLIKHLGSPEFMRVRVGIGRPQHGEVTDWVLSNFSGEDAPFADELVDRDERALKCLLAEGLDSAMSQFHTPGARDTGRPSNLQVGNT